MNKFETLSIDEFNFDAIENSLTLKEIRWKYSTMPLNFYIRGRSKTVFYQLEFLSGKKHRHEHQWLRYSMYSPVTKTLEENKQLPVVYVPYELNAEWLENENPSY